MQPVTDTLEQDVGGIGEQCQASFDFRIHHNPAGFRIGLQQKHRAANRRQDVVAGRRPFRIVDQDRKRIRVGLIQVLGKLCIPHRIADLFQCVCPASQVAPGNQVIPGTS